MRFITRSLMGLFLTTLTIALLALAANSIVSAYKNVSSGGYGDRKTRERMFSVEVGTFILGSQIPEITTFGEVISGRTLELRATASGALVQISPNFREGGIVKKGELLFQIDPATAQSRVLIAQNELAEAKADLDDALRNLSLAEAEIIAAENQLALRQKSIKRQSDLRKRGVGTDAAIETAELAASSAEQALLSKRLSLANAQTKIARAETLLDRRKINLAEAERLVSETQVIAEFDGVLSDVSAVLGRLVNANEKLGQLIDPAALEVSFRVSSAEFRALTATLDGLKNAQVRVSLDAKETDFTGQIDRVSAAVGQGKTGRELFAKLQNVAKLGILPGDFVTVQLREPPLKNTAKIPARAASASGQVLLIGDDNRLEEATVEILHKQGDDLIVRADDLEGRRFVLSRAPQLGEGILVEPRTPGATSLTEPEMISLPPDRRAQIQDAIRNNKRIPAEARERLIKKFDAETVPKALVERFETRVAENAPASEVMVEITPEQRKAMIAFLQANNKMPAARKAEVLEKLQQPRVPKSMVDRITKRMGG